MNELIKRIKGLKVLVVGDVMLDRYVKGEVRRISPEAPVPVLNVGDESSAAGGAANVALNVKALGGTVECLGSFGNDERGKELIALLSSSGVVVDAKCIVEGSATISKTRVMASNQQICRVDREETPENYNPNLSDLGEVIEQKAASADVVIVSDYGKGFVTSELVALLRTQSSFLAIDPKPSRLLDYKSPDLFTPNRIEALEIAGFSRFYNGEFPTEVVIRRIFESFGPSKLAITLGSKGMLLAEDGKYVDLIPTAAREVYDVSGAGDTAIAALSMCLASGANFVSSSRLANLAAGIVVGKVGTASVSVGELSLVIEK